MITEGGFGSDMGFEKHVNLVCRRAGFHPSAVVLVATLRALRHHGDGDLATGAANLERHVEIVRGFGIDPVVAVNRFPDDSDADVELVRALALEYGAFAAEATSAYSEGGVARLLSLKRSPRPASGPQAALLVRPAGSDHREDREAGAQRLRRGRHRLSPEAEQTIVACEREGLERLPICMAKTTAVVVP